MIHYSFTLELSVSRHAIYGSSLCYISLTHLAFKATLDYFFDYHFCPKQLTMSKKIELAIICHPACLCLVPLVDMRRLAPKVSAVCLVKRIISK